MEARMKNPAMLLPAEATKAIQTLYGMAHKGSIPAKTLELVHLRASQINGCGFCVDSGPLWREATRYYDEAGIAATSRPHDVVGAAPLAEPGDLVRHFVMA